MLSDFLQRIFNCDKIHDTSITSDEVLNTLVYGSFFCVIIWSEFSWLKLIGILGQYGLSKFIPRIFKYGDILNITFTPDKELNILIYRLPSYLIIYRSHALLKNGPGFLGPPCISSVLYICKSVVEHFFHTISFLHTDA